ncbi:MAG: imidazole glycerol phosphate synthase subunit HisF [Thermoguttaceae bacterium]
MIVIIDYGAGNPASVKLAFDTLGIESVVSRDAAVIAAASRLVFPGVGAAAWAMQHLRSSGLVEPIFGAIKRGVPFLGICLGMQVLLDSSEEDGGTPTLGIVPGNVVRITSRDAKSKVPQIGWNVARPIKTHPVFDGLDSVRNSGNDFYFVHSYVAKPTHDENVVAVTNYAGIEFASAVARGSVVAVQFHPEKSGPAGLRLLRNFAAWNGLWNPSPNSQTTNTHRAGKKFRIIPCLDVTDKRVTKGVKFQNNVDCGDPAFLAKKYYDEGADELVFYDITASSQRRKIDIAMVREVASVVHIPFAVGGGISCVDDMHNILDAGAEKVSVNSLAVAEPAMIAEAVKAFGRQCLVLGIDPVASDDVEKFPSGYEITTHGFRLRTGLDAVEWVKRCEQLGVGEVVVNSVDRDGTRAGFELELTGLLASQLSIPVVASGGAGSVQHIADVIEKTEATAAILAGVLHRGELSLTQIRRELTSRGLPLRDVL